MKQKRLPAAPLAILSALLLCATAAAQTKPFGSSLKRPKAGAADKANKDAGPQEPDAESAAEVVRVDTSLVLLDVLVTDSTGKKAITGLKGEDFVVTEDGEPQEVSFFALGDDAQKLPRSIVLVFDRSGSQLAYLEASVEAAKKLVNQLAPTDEMAIVTDDVQLASGFTRDKKRLKSTLDALKKFTYEGYHTRSMQFSALLATLRELIDVKTRRAVIILQTDGDEVGRLSGWPPVMRGGQEAAPLDYDMNDVYAEAEKSRAKIYAVVPNERLLGLPADEAERRAMLTIEKREAARRSRPVMWYGMRRLPPEKSAAPPAGASIPLEDPAFAATLRELREKSLKRAVETLVEGQVAAARVAELTGGWASFLERPEDADAVYGRILADINQRYVVGYYPSNKSLDGKLRQVKVEVRGHPEYVVQGRRSYFTRPR